VSDTVHKARLGAHSAEPEGANTTKRDRSMLIPAMLGGLLLLFLTFPLIAMMLRAAGTPDVLESIRQPLVYNALRLTLISSFLCLLVAIVTGTPLAWFLARRNFRGKRIIDTLVDLPIIIPPVVAGVALLMAFGRRGLLGEHLLVFGISIPFTLTAVVMAQLFIAVPFYVRGAKIGFQGVDVFVERAAAMDGASRWQTFRHVTLPLAFPGIASGAVLCWARAVSEFGATLLFAGNISGRTQTMPLAVVTAMETSLSAALALSLLMVGISAITLFAMRTVLGTHMDR
jgi:molybdate transport system permease protein